MLTAGLKNSRIAASVGRCGSVFELKILRSNIPNHSFELEETWVHVLLVAIGSGPLTKAIAHGGFYAAV